MAGEQGFEPRYHGPEPCVLPLDDSPKIGPYYTPCEIKFKTYPRPAASLPGSSAIVIKCRWKGVLMKRMLLLFLLLAPALMAAQRQVFIETVGEEW